MTQAGPHAREAEMIAAVLAGNTAVFHDLIRPYERSVYVMALAVMRNEADAEEVAQETFLKAYRSLAAFRMESRFGTWLVSIALNEERGRLRRGRLLRDAIEALPPIYREIFTLRGVQELSVAECAETLGITLSASKVRLHRARLMLQKALAPHLKRLNSKRRWFPW
jgi:RNA polymerase sigma-70 factor (ECF subfamily)